MQNLLNPITEYDHYNFESFIKINDKVLIYTQQISFIYCKGIVCKHQKLTLTETFSKTSSIAHHIFVDMS